MNDHYIHGSSATERQRLALMNELINARCLRALDLEMGSMDLAHSRFLLEHVQDPAGVVRAMVGAVRPGRRIVLLDDDHELMRF